MVTSCLHFTICFRGLPSGNGGNYWQQGLERGCIASKKIRLLRSSGDAVVFEEEARWMDTRGPRGEYVEGLAILPHPENDWMPTLWFTRNYGFFSPTPTWWWTEPFRLEAGEKLTFRYRVVVHSGDPDKSEIERQFEDWAQPTAP